MLGQLLCHTVAEDTNATSLHCCVQPGFRDASLHVCPPSICDRAKGICSIKHLWFFIRGVELLCRVRRAPEFRYKVPSPSRVGQNLLREVARRICCRTCATQNVSEVVPLFQPNLCLSYYRTMLLLNLAPRGVSKKVERSENRVCGHTWKEF